MLEKAACIVCLLVLLSSCAMQRGDDVGVDMYLVSIDRDIWTKTETIKWPSGSRYVAFFYDERAVYDSCLMRYSEVINSIYSPGEGKSLRVGEACEKLIVLYRDDGLVRSVGLLGVDFIAHHESFHLAAQLYGMRLPMRYLKSGRGAESDDFFSDAQNLFYSPHRKLTMHSMCGFINSKFLPLSRSRREEISRLVFWEWPAEYYAYMVLAKKKGLALDEYVAIRKKLGSFHEYAPGVLMGIFLDDAIGRQQWQEMISNGMTMLDVVGSSCNADYSPSVHPLVHVNKVDLLSRND